MVPSLLSRPARRCNVISSTELLSMKGRHVLITGASAGIGQAIANRFADAGASLTLVDIDESGLATTAASIREQYACPVNTHRIDLSHKQNIEDLWQGISDPVPEILVNNAGIYPMQDYLQVDQEFLSKTLGVNLESVFWMCQNFIKRRIGQGGIIVNISSIEAILPFKHDLVSYSVSKAGVLALTRALARDYGKHGFRVNVILPGAIRTPGTHTLVSKAIKRLQFHLIKTGYDFQNRLALGRWGKPDEVAKVVLFLASDMASYVQGTMIPVDGGFLST